MKKSLSVAIALTTMASATLATAEVEIYGKVNVSFEFVEEGDDSATELVSNASRLGFKGAESINDDLTAIYQLEYEVFVDDGDKGGKTFTQRNSFVGVKGDFGQVIGGHFDTPLKAAQNKVDLFNDLRGDIKHVITPNENRESNIVAYTTPATLGGFEVDAALVNSEVDGVDDGISVALSWADEHFYIASAMDQDVEAEGVDALRLVMQYNRDQWQFGALYEETDADFIDDSLAAYLVSAAYKLNQNWVFKLQHSASDGYLKKGVIEFEDVRATNVGADYILTKKAKVFGFYTDESADNDALDNSYAGIGMEVKF